MVSFNKDEWQIKVLYDDNHIQVCSNKNLPSLAICEKIALAMLRQLDKSPKGKERLKQIGAVVNCWGMD